MAGREPISIQDHEARREGAVAAVQYGEEGSLFLGRLLRDVIVIS
jgi:hypothetical protein